METTLSIADHDERKLDRANTTERQPVLVARAFRSLPIGWDRRGDSFAVDRFDVDSFAVDGFDAARFVALSRRIFKRFSRPTFGGAERPDWFGPALVFAGTVPAACIS